MSRITDLGKNFEKIVDIVHEYNKALEGVEDILKIQGKRLEVANMENTAWQNYYDQKRVELYTLVKYMDSQVEKVRGSLFRSYTEAYNRELSDRAKDKYINNEPKYLQMYEIFLEIKELYEKYDSVVESFKSRSFALNNITKLRVSSLEETIV